MIGLEALLTAASHRGIRWRSRWVGFIGGVASGGIAATSTAAILGTGATTAIVALSIAGTLIGLGAWWLSCRVPRNRQKSIGIALAIRAETEAERKRVRSDFVAEIKACFLRREASAPFEIIEIPSYLSPDPTDAQAALRYLRESKCHLLIWGGIRTRTKSKASVYCLHLEGAVTHGLIEQEASKQLAVEMRSAIPQRTIIALANELSGFETASASIALGSKYVVALAAALSGDRLLSSTLMLELLQEVGDPRATKRKRSRKHSVRDLSSRIGATLPNYLSDICLAEYVARANAWQGQKDNLAHLQSAEQYLEQHRAYSKNPDSPSLAYLVGKALIEVTLRGNIPEAERLLLKCRAKWIGDPTWRLSLAFVRVVQNRPEDALALYDAASARDVPPNTILDIEDYVQWWLTNHDGPRGLYLLSAMLNWGWKRDTVLAGKDLRRFEVLGGTSDSRLATRCAELKAEIESGDTGLTGAIPLALSA